MFPTVLGLAGAEWPSSRVAGKDRSAAILSGAVDGEQYVFAENHDVPCAHYTAMARSKTHKLVLYLGGREGPGPFYELYDLRGNPQAPARGVQGNPGEIVSQSS